MLSNTTLRISDAEVHITHFITDSRHRLITEAEIMLEMGGDSMEWVERNAEMFAILYDTVGIKTKQELTRLLNLFNNSPYHT